MKLKKSVGIFLALTMVVGSLTACGDTNADADGTGAAQSGTENGEAANSESGYPFEIKDLDGYVFTVADNNTARWFPEEGSSEIANAVLERVNMVQDLFNCKIEVVPYDETEFSNAHTAGDKYADIVVCETWSLGRHIGAGRIVDLAQLDGLNLDADYWNKYSTNNLLSFRGKVYGASAPFASQANEIFMMFFNKNVIEELGLESPYDLYEKDEWTLSKFVEYCQKAKKDLNGDGIFDTNDRYGFAPGHEYDGPVVLYLGAGMHFYREMEDGSIKFEMNTPEAFSITNIIKNDCYNPGDSLFPRNTSDDQNAYAEAFAAGKALFYCYSRGRGVADPIYDMEDDFGIVPLPKGDDKDTYYCWVSHDAPSVSVPANNPDKDKTALIMEALAYFSQEENELELEEFCNTKLRDEESRKILYEIPQYACSDLAFIGQQCGAGGFYDVLNAFYQVNYVARENEIASSIAAIEIKVETGIEDFIRIMEGNNATEE